MDSKGQKSMSAWMVGGVRFEPGARALRRLAMGGAYVSTQASTNGEEEPALGQLLCSVQLPLSGRMRLRVAVWAWLEACVNPRVQFVAESMTRLLPAARTKGRLCSLTRWG